MEEAKSILPLWQPVGFSTHLISQRVGEYFNTKTSHTGTLDPMAEGVVIVLTGEERRKKHEYAKWHKFYEFEILFGIETDTFDGLGVFDSAEYLPPKNITRKKVNAVLEKFIGEYTQTVPIFSTKKIKGKHLHEYARVNQKIDLPEKTGTIYTLKLKKLSQKSLSGQIDRIITNIIKVTGDFRQLEILRLWKELQSRAEKQNVLIAQFSVETSKGIYIRSLAQDICEKLNTKGIVLSLVRRQNGIYNTKNCKTLDQIFGSDYRNTYDFVSRVKA